MSLSCSFFDHVKYPAQEFHNRDADFIGNGIINPATDFSLSYPGGLVINVAGTGTSWVAGRRISYDANPVIALNFNAPDSVNTRIDLIEIGFTGEGAQGAAVIKVVTGIAQQNPIQPQPDQNFIALYAVRVSPGLTQITNSNVTDLRSRTTFMGVDIPGQSTANENSINLINSQLSEIAILPNSFGIKGDGVTDDTTAIQNMLNSLPYNTTGKGLKVKLPSGKYLITSISIPEWCNFRRRLCF